MGDPIGKMLAIIILVIMLLVLVGSVWRVLQRKVWSVTAVWWQMPVVASLGVGVAFYLMVLTWLPETAVCIPVTDCHILQQSRFAYPFGVPVGIWLIISYLAILGVWIVAQFGPDSVKRIAPWTIFIVAIGGELFSIYFTFLESFVIGQTCAWCLMAAVLMTILFWQSTETLYATRLHKNIS